MIRGYTILAAYKNKVEKWSEKQLVIGIHPDLLYTIDRENDWYTVPSKAMFYVEQSPTTASSSFFLIRQHAYLRRFVRERHGYEGVYSLTNTSFYTIKSSYEREGYKFIVVPVPGDNILRSLHAIYTRDREAKETLLCIGDRLLPELRRLIACTILGK
jgi:hypothetical protein